MVSLCKCTLNTLKKNQSNTFICVFATVKLTSNKKKSTHGDCQTKVAFISFWNRQHGPHINSPAHDNSATVGIRTKVFWKNWYRGNQLGKVSISFKHPETVFFSLICTCNISNNKTANRSHGKICFVWIKAQFLSLLAKELGKIYQPPL